MSPVTLLLAEVVLGGGCLALAWAPARRAAVNRDAARALSLALKALPEIERLTALARLAGPSHWAGRLAAEVLEANDERAKIAAANDALAEVEHALRLGEAWPATSLRITLFGSTLFGIIAYLALRAPLFALAILGVGAAAALACSEAGRALRRLAVAERQAVDVLVSVALGSLTRAAPEMPERRAHRRPARRVGRSARG